MSGILDNPDAAYAKLKEMGKGLFGPDGGGWRWRADQRPDGGPGGSGGSPAAASRRIRSAASSARPSAI